MRYRCALVVLAVTLMLGACTFHVTEQNFVRPVPDPADAPAPAAGFAGLVAEPQALQITASDGTRLHAVALTQPAARLTVLFFGGNLSRVSSGGRRVAEQLLPLGVNLLLVDHRGSGRSEGQPTVDLLLSDALAVFDYLTHERGIPAATIVVHGHSLGSFMAGHVARNRPVGGLVLSGSATNTQDWVAASVPWYFKPFVHTEIDPALVDRGNLAAVEQQRAPLLVIGGQRDELSPPILSRKLAAAAQRAQRPVALVIARGADHEHLLDHADVIAAYRTLLQGIVDSLRGAGAG
jgi:uncharacterized protein